MRRIVTTCVLLRLVVAACAGTASAFVTTWRRRPFVRDQLPASHHRPRREPQAARQSASASSGVYRAFDSTTLASSFSAHSWNSTYHSIDIPRFDVKLWSNPVHRRNAHPSMGIRQRQTLELDSSQTDRNAAVADVRDLVQMSLAPTEAVTPTPFHVYCDLDGVLVDFAHGISQVFGETDLGVGHTWTSQNIDALPRRYLWEKVQSADAFFEKLPWCDGGRELWAALAPLRPDILTGVPSYCTWAPRAEKFAWCRRELGRAVERAVDLASNVPHGPNRVDNDLIPLAPTRFSHVDKAGRFRMHYPVNSDWHDGFESTDDANEWNCKVITCWSEQKHHESGPGIVLIDDRVALRAAWEAKGGIFIHHITGDVEHTLQQLRHHGVLSSATATDNRRDGMTHTIQHSTYWERTDLQP